MSIFALKCYIFVAGDALKVRSVFSLTIWDGWDPLIFFHFLCVKLSNFGISGGQVPPLSPPPPPAGTHGYSIAVGNM